MYIYLIGFGAQILFSARLLVQWIKSEKVKQVLTPELFWELSLIASFLLFIYGWLRNDFAIILGQSLTYFIYIRNMQLQGSWKKLPSWVRPLVWMVPPLIVLYSFNNGEIDVNQFFHNKNIGLPLLIWGVAAQVVFTFRFVYQWIYSERRKESSLPNGFWILSLSGSLMILSYAIIRLDPVLFIGQIFGATVYIRNILIGRKQRKSEANY